MQWRPGVMLSLWGKQQTLQDSVLRVLTQQEIILKKLLLLKLQLGIRFQFCVQIKQTKYSVLISEL